MAEFYDKDFFYTAEIHGFNKENLFILSHSRGKIILPRYGLELLEKIF
jgi:hypothetical protein